LPPVLPEPDRPHYKGVLATVLTAQTTGKTLMMGTQLAAVGSGSYCQILYVYLLG